jgi:periodic tryptophan protein 2
MIFDPIALTEAVTPGAVQSNLRSGQYGTALVMSLTLNEFSLVKEVLENTPFRSISHVVRSSVGPEHLERLLQFVSKCMTDSPHLEFYLQWCLELLQTHGMYLEKHRGTFMRAFRAMHKMVQTRHEDVKTICDDNRYTMDFIEDQAKLLMDETKIE